MCEFMYLSVCILLKKIQILFKNRIITCQTLLDLAVFFSIHYGYLTMLTYVFLQQNLMAASYTK